MDLVDIDQVLDNLELHEEAENEQRRAEEKLSKNAEALKIAASNSNGLILQQTKEQASGEKSGFKAVSQVFNSLDEYCKNVESLESKGIESRISCTEQKSHADYDNEHRYQASHAAAASAKQELEEYENELEGSKDIHKFTEEKRNRLKSSNESPERDTTDSSNSITSESLTTSSNSTFSSGPSFEAESSLEEPTPLTNSKENERADEDSENSQIRKYGDKNASTSETNNDVVGASTSELSQNQDGINSEEEHLIEDTQGKTRNKRIKKSKY
ncbi:hypothetical protein DOY81_009385 [Sarcophaga bullata]|nr:hypothetical protein DOY81_009385 [Sarcophaga bullata]